MKDFFGDYTNRKWIYGVLVAIFLLLSGYGFIAAERYDDWIFLFTALLNLGGSGAFGLAATKSKPAQTDPQIPPSEVVDDTPETIEMGTITQDVIESGVIDTEYSVDPETVSEETFDMEQSVDKNPSN